MPTVLDILNSNKKYCYNPSKDNPNDLPDQTGIYYDKCEKQGLS